jgi:uncharacterized protein YqgC (DUF456 family)
MTAALLWVLAVGLIGVGLIGIVMPALPGTVLVFAGLCLAAWAEGFTRVSIGTVVAIGILAAGSYGIDFVAAAAGVKRVGASRRAMVGATLGTLLGLFFGLPGVIVGPFVGAVIGEFSAHQQLARAGRVGYAAWIGFLVGTVVKIGVVFVMLGIFLVALFVA